MRPTVPGTVGRMRFMGTLYITSPKIGVQLFRIIQPPYPTIARTTKYNSDGPSRQPSPVWNVAVSAP
jgi:hypothetical protein